MTIEEIYEKYKHLDLLLSDRNWLPGTPMDTVLFDLWQAVREAATAPAAPAADKPQVRFSDAIAQDAFNDAMKAAGWEPLRDRFKIAIEWQACTGKVVAHLTALEYWWVSGMTPGKMI